MNLEYLRILTEKEATGQNDTAKESTNPSQGEQVPEQFLPD
jgi:hypothetical protein